MAKKSATPALEVIVTRPDLMIHPDRVEIARSVVRHLTKHAYDLYRFRDRLAFVKEVAEADQSAGLPTIVAADREDLKWIVHHHMQPVKLGKNSRVEITLPDGVAKLLLAAKVDLSAFRPIFAVSATPLVRDDGSVRLDDGYDETSGILCDFRTLPRFEVPNQPSEQDARAALLALRELFQATPFADRVCRADNPQLTDLEEDPGADESTFLHALMLAPLRPSMSAAPGVVIRATAMSGGSAGKTTLGRTLAHIAFGRVPSDTPFGRDMPAFEKILGSALRTGRACLIFDNGNNLTLRSNLLALVLTSEHAEDRELGKSEMRALASRALLIFTGNALAVAEDLVRRTLVVNLDTRSEHPERRNMPAANFFDDVIVPNRAAILQHLLTIWRWGRQDPQPHGRPLANYDVFCRWIRDPLTALGCRDPVERIDAMKAEDPQRQEMEDIFLSWWKHHRDNDVKAHELHEAVCSLVDPQFANNRRHRVTYRLNQWLEMRVAGFHLTSNRAYRGKWSKTKYRLLRVDPDEPQTADDE
jgi:hypothetical protein